VLAGLAAAVPGQVRVAVTEPAGGIVFGQPFELTVTGATAGFDEQHLLPLVVERLGSPGGPAAPRRFRARCYVPGEVTLALDPTLRLVVATSLPEPPGELEWPGDGWPLPERRWPAALWLALVALAALAAIVWARLLRRTAPTSATPKPDASWSALAALAALPATGDPERFHAQLKSILRRHCRERYAVRAFVRTSEELVASVPRGAGELQHCLGACDLVLFGGARPAAAAADAVHATARAFVAATEDTP
jgi:hypothetical protein